MLKRIDPHKYEWLHSHDFTPNELFSNITMETLGDFKQLFQHTGDQINAEVKDLLNAVSVHTPDEMIAVANRLGDETLSQTEIDLLSKLVWLGIGVTGLAAANRLLLEKRNLTTPKSTEQLLQSKDTDKIIEMLKCDMAWLLKHLIPFEVELQERNNELLRQGKSDLTDLNHLVLHFAATQVALARVNDQKRFLENEEEI